MGASRLSTTFLAAIIAAGAFGVTSVRAHEYPSRPVKIIVPQAGGGEADQVARVLAERLTRSFGQTFTVENQAGKDNGGAAIVAQSAPDGYTLLLDTSTFAHNPSLFPRLGYAHKAFAPVSLVVRFPNILVAGPGFSGNSVKDLVSMAKARPGTLAYASQGKASAQHLAGELFEQQAGVDMRHKSIKDSARLMDQVLSGRVPVFFASMASNLAQMKSGTLKALATTGSKRSPHMPGLPTVAEAGVPGYEAYEWTALFAPAGTPAAVLGKLHGEIEKAMASADVRERIHGMGGEIVASNPDATRDFVSGQIDKWTKVVKQAHISVDSLDGPKPARTWLLIIADAGTGVRHG